MRIASFQFPVFKPYNMATLEIYFQGCNRTNCTGPCHNPKLKDPNGGSVWRISEILCNISERDELIRCVSFTGGEPLHQEAINEVKVLASGIKQRKKKLWLFTGEDSWEDIPQWCKEVFDVIKYGGYKKEFAQEGFPASSNQKLMYKGQDYNG